MNLKIFFTIVILGLVGIFNFYLVGIIGLLKFLVTLGIYAIIIYLFHILWKTIRKKEILDFKKYLEKFLYSISWILLLLFGIIGGFAVIVNEFFPALMPEYTISNGEKIVKFQAMVHIGTESYYNEIKNNLINFKEKGGVYFFEGVRPGSEENMEKFNKALGIQFDEDLYENYSKLYGVTFQDTTDFLGLVNNLDSNIDLTIDEIMVLYDEKVSKLTEKKDDELIYDVSGEVMRILSNLNERELKLLVYMNQAILNFLMNNDSVLESMADTFTNKELFEVILGERNKVVTEAIINSEYDKIYITYGLLHFNGIYNLLKEQDPRWEIIETKDLYPIK